MRKGIGRLKYRVINGGQDWWLSINCCPDLGRYYRTLFIMGTWNTRPIQIPTYAPHVSIVKRIEPPNKRAWGKYKNKKIQFFYNHTIHYKKPYYGLMVSCPEADRIRKELGLRPMADPLWSIDMSMPYHLTIGNDKNLINTYSAPKQIARY